MPKLQFLEQKLSEPMTCQHARERFPDLLAEKLDREQRGRVEGHLLSCEDCSEAFAEAIDQALARDELPQTDIPPLAVPSVLTAVSGRGVIQAWLWKTVQQEGKTAVRAAQRAASATSQAIRNEVEATKGDWQAARQIFEECEKRLHQSFPMWQLTAQPAGGRPLRTRGPGPKLGSLGDRPGATKPAIHLNEAWEKIEQTSTWTIETAIKTADGQLHITVSTEETNCQGHRLICVIRLIEGQAIRTEADIQAASDGVRWRAEFHEQLPPTPEDVAVPLDLISLYLVPLSSGTSTLG